jgi:hypothetical protein
MAAVVGGGGVQQGQKLHQLVLIEYPFDGVHVCVVNCLVSVAVVLPVIVAVAVPALIHVFVLYFATAGAALAVVVGLVDRLFGDAWVRVRVHGVSLFDGPKICIRYIPSSTL